MILNKECYWNIMDYTFKHLKFIEDSMNPSDFINIDTDTEETRSGSEMSSRSMNPRNARRRLFSAPFIYLCSVTS